MNTVEELIGYGISKYNAENMIKHYTEHIGNKSGIYTITDINYIPNSHYKDVILECDLCHKERVYKFDNDTKKWRDLPKKCDCQRVKISKIPKEKKERIVAENNEKKMVVARETYLGKKIPGTRLTVVDFDYRPSPQGRSKQLYAHCVCDCGNQKDIQFYVVQKAIVKSCGCLAKEIQQERREQYHKTSSPLYKIWNGMKQRCNNPNSPSYSRYGGRGIKVCDDWINDFEVFEKWSFDNGYRPNQGLSIDRIDVNGNYEPSNCRWSSIFVQSVNKTVPAHIQIQRICKKIEIGGEKHTRKEWLEIYGVYDAAVRYREKHMSMTFEQALKAEKEVKGNHLNAYNLPKSQAKSNDDLNKCRSYIEANFFLAFLRKDVEFSLTSQYKIDDMTVDFCEEELKVVVECDGYDYHKSKEQQTLDCQRDRKLLANGYWVLRFSGSEINANSDKCASEVIEFLNKRKEQMLCQDQLMIQKNMLSKLG